MARKLKGKQRKETKDEKRARLDHNREAHEKCAKALPVALVLLAALFAAVWWLAPQQPR